MDTATQKRLLANLRAYLTRRKNSRGKAVEYTCIEGPFNGHSIFLHDGTPTVQFTVGEFRGRYTQTNVAKYYHEQRRAIKSVIWEQSS